MKIKHSFLLWGLVFLLFVSCGEKQNYLSGQIEGLEPGDCIILGLIDPITDEIYISDSTIVEKKNHFDLYTKATDQWAYLAHCPKNEKIKIEHHRGNRFRLFLEGYASLHLSGSTDNFHYLKITGGLYETPDLRPAFNLMDSALLIQQDGIGRSPSDPLRRTLIKKSNRMLMTVDSMEQQFADTHPDFAYSAAIMRYVNEKELEKRFRQLTPRVQKSVPGIAVSNHLQIFRSTQPGGLAPDFTLLSLTGDSIRLSDYKGKHVFLEFWGSWCGPCRMVAPIMKELAKEYADKIVVDKVNVDKEKELAALFNATSIPLFVFIPMNGEPQLFRGAADKATYKKAIDDFLLKTE